MAPRLYIGTGGDLKKRLANSHHMLAKEIDALTAGRAVVRMEIDEPGAAHFNLPRTETVTGDQAASWISDQIAEHEQKVMSLDNVAFIAHAFLPAQAGVWAYADPGQPIAYVDALWGLPDGLQVLPHDTYQIDVRRSKVVSEKIRCKSRFLQENAAGEWKYFNVLRKKSRSSTLRRSDAVEIGVRTAAIATKLGERAQIMWFSGVPEGYQVGRNLPWFRARETFDPAPRQAPRFKPFKVSTVEQLRKLPAENVTIRLDPDADLIRDDTYLDEVIAVAQARGLPVEIEGSALSHMYYRLFQAGVAVNPPNYAGYYRSRGRRVFGKLVRDKIPNNIEVGGEIVREARLAKADLQDALLAKLIEEMLELRDSETSESKIEEISDLHEVIRALAISNNIEWSAVSQKSDEKRQSRGSFLERRVLVETSLASPSRREKDDLEVRLHEVDTPRSLGAGSATFPFSSMFDAKSGIDVALDDGLRLNLTVRMTKQGTVVTFKRRGDQAEGERQLDFFSK